MESAKVALGLSKLKVLDLVAFIRFIVTQMTGNAAFTTPKPPLTDLTTAADALETAEQNKKALGIANRNEKLNEAKNVLRKEALYVQDVSNGNAAIIESSGMPLQKPRTPQGLPGTVKSLKIGDGTNQGEAVVTHRGADGKNCEYFVQYNTDPSLNEKSWVSIEPSGKLKVLIKGLISGRRTAFRVRAKNTAGYGEWSTVAFRTIQ